MLGQRIIESYADLPNDDDSPLLQAEFTSLTVRRIKSAGLRIVTESETESPDALRDNTNTLRPPNYRNSFMSIRTPDTSHTFGLPNPSMFSPDSTTSHRHTPASTPSPASAELLASRRLSRYSRAESALQSAVEASSAEVSPHELQIQVLERATAVLSEQARDAQACAERLRACLADKELPPEEFKSLQRARWLEEHKSTAKQAQSAHTRELVVKLSSPIKEEPPFIKSPRVMTREEMNLARFLQRSPTRIAFPPTRSPPVSPVLHRRKTLAQVRPLRLRVSAMDLALRSPLRTHGRASSLDGGHARSESASTDATFVSQDSNGQTAVTKPSISHLKLASSLSPLPFPSKGEGIVSIEKYAALRSREELLAEVGDVTLPDYAVDLLEDLVGSSLDISLPEIAGLGGAPTTHTGSEPDIAFSSAADYGPEPITPLLFSRIRSQSDTPPPSSPSITHPTARRRSAAPTPRTSFRHSLAAPRFSSLRLSGPSLEAVPEGPSTGSDAPSRPHSSLSGRFMLDSSSALRGSTDGSPRPSGDQRRYSVVSFRRLERTDSGARRSGGILARFKQRFSTLGQ
ncbi:hypothetical protein TRAPUB_9105 [Trametes pubescens]|uniref:Uncharacterized protein n=1 Tax=Trametes pubescens TaxID=154538 RepID=A0A1M2W3B6_TRAPU|nr:hypothetical protein TRAPUB_9105 [Trametes pubescens]